MLKSAGAKALFAVAVLLFTIALCLTTACSHYTCTIEDIGRTPKCSDVTLDIRRLNLSINDEITLFLYFDHELNEEETKQIEALGATFWPNSWLPPTSEHPWGIYTIECKVENICKIANLDEVKRIDSGETPGELTE